MIIKQLQTAMHEPRLRRTWLCICGGLLLVVGASALAPGSVAPTVTASDKLDHVLALAALSATALLAMAPGARNSLRASAGMLAYGVLIELLQTQVPGRFADLQDVVADAIGVALGVALIGALRWGTVTPPQR